MNDFTPKATVATEEPLPATLGFVFTIGAAILVGWVLMFLLLRSRW